MLRSGVSLDDRYRLDERVATGGMGDVWRATDLTLGRTVAVKVLLPSLSADPGFGARFLAESRMLAAVRHPGVVQVYDRGDCPLPDGGRATYLVMEFVDGEPLSARLAREGRLPAAEAMRIVAEAARALDAVHEGGIIHRDVKPSNLLLRPDGSVVLLDFGVARSTAVTSVTGTNAAVLGTALYMAPEQARRQAVSPATDVYALGAVAYHTLAGDPPFMGDNPVAVAMMHLDTAPPDLPADVPPAVRAVVMRMLEKEPADRYQSGAALASAALSAVGAGPLASTAEMAAVDDPDATVRAAAVDATAPVAAGDATRVVRPVNGVRPSDTATVPAAAGGGGRRRTAAIAGAVAGAGLLVLLALLLFLPDGNTPPADGGTTTAPSATPGATSRPAGGDQPDRPRQTGAATSSEAPATGEATEEPEPTPSPTPPADETTAPEDPEPTASEPESTPGDDEGEGSPGPDSSPRSAGGGRPTTTNLP